MLPILTGAARYALTKALGRKKAAVMAPTVVPWTFWERQDGADGTAQNEGRIDFWHMDAVDHSGTILPRQNTQLRHTLDSLLIQDTYDFELIIADDGSPEIIGMTPAPTLAAHSFTSVKLSKNEVNQGTVINISTLLN